MNMNTAIADLTSCGCWERPLNGHHSNPKVVIEGGINSNSDDHRGIVIKIVEVFDLTLHCKTEEWPAPGTEPKLREDQALGWALMLWLYQTRSYK